MPIVEVHSPADMIVSLEGPQPVRIYPDIPAEINVYLFDTVAFKGFDGKSCYEYAVEGGYKGTEAEFTACMNKWLNEVCQADPVFTPHSAYFGFSTAETISDATIGTLTHDPANTLAAREWPVTNSQSPTPLYAHIVVPATVASYINTVGIKGGLPGIWGQAPVSIGGQPYIDIRSPYKFADAFLTLVTTSKSGSISAMTWVTTNGQTILAHIANNAIHLTPQDRTKLDNLSGVNTGDQDLTGLEPKRGADDFYVSATEKGRLDRLLVDFIVPSDTSSLDFSFNHAGVSFASMNLRSVLVIAGGNLTSTGSTPMYFRLNSVNSGYNNSNFPGTDSFYTSIDGVFASHAQICVSPLGCSFFVNTFRSASLNPAVNAAHQNISGINPAVNTKIDRVTLLSGVKLFKAGSQVTIYRND